MADPFTRAEKNMTVWQRCRRVLNAAMAESPGNFEQIARTVYAYVLRERADAAENGRDDAVDFSRVNRVEVVDETGRAFVRYYGGAGVQVHVQDDGRTLKVFVDGVWGS